MPKRIGELLIEAGAVTPEAVEEALARQRDGAPERLGELLEAMGACSSIDIARALAAQAQLPFTVLSTVPRHVRGLVPVEVQRRLALTPIGAAPDGTLALAVADTRGLPSVDELSRLLHRPVRLFVSPREQVETAVSRAAEPLPPEEPSVRWAFSGSEPATPGSAAGARAGTRPAGELEVDGSEAITGADLPDAASSGVSASLGEDVPTAVRAVDVETLRASSGSVTGVGQQRASFSSLDATAGDDSSPVPRARRILAAADEIERLALAASAAKTPAAPANPPAGLKPIQLVDRKTEGGVLPKSLQSPPPPKHDAKAKTVVRPRPVDVLAGLTDEEAHLLDAIERLARGGTVLEEPEALQPARLVASLVRLLLRKGLLAERELLDELLRK